MCDILPWILLLEVVKFCRHFGFQRMGTLEESHWTQQTQNAASEDLKKSLSKEHVFQLLTQKNQWLNIAEHEYFKQTTEKEINKTKRHFSKLVPSLFSLARSQLQLLFSLTVGAFYKLHLLFITGKTDVILNWTIIWVIFAAGRKIGYKPEVEISL